MQIQIAQAENASVLGCIEERMNEWFHQWMDFPEARLSLGETAGRVASAKARCVTSESLSPVVFPLSACFVTALKDESV